MAVNLSETFLPQTKRCFSDEGSGDSIKAEVLLWLGPILDRLTSSILPLIGSTRDTGERGDIEVLVVAARLRLPEREEEGLSL